MHDSVTAPRMYASSGESLMSFIARGRNLVALPNFDERLIDCRKILFPVEIRNFSLSKLRRDARLRRQRRWRRPGLRVCERGAHKICVFFSQHLRQPASAYIHCIYVHIIIEYTNLSRRIYVYGISNIAV